MTAKPVPAPSTSYVLGRVLLPLRAFLGFTFCFAGLQKLANPGFFDAANPASIQSQLAGAARLSPIFRYERLDAPQVPLDPTMPGSPLVADAGNPSEKRIGGGLAFWPFGYNTNFKVFGSRIHREPGVHDYNQFNVQWQLYFF